VELVVLVAVLVVVVVAGPQLVIGPGQEQCPLVAGRRPYGYMDQR